MCEAYNDQWGTTGFAVRDSNENFNRILYWCDDIGYRMNTNERFYTREALLQIVGLRS